MAWRAPELGSGRRRGSDVRRVGGSREGRPLRQGKAGTGRGLDRRLAQSSCPNQVGAKQKWSHGTRTRSGHNRRLPQPRNDTWKSARPAPLRQPGLRGTEAGEGTLVWEAAQKATQKTCVRELPPPATRPNAATVFPRPSEDHRKLPRIPCAHLPALQSLWPKPGPRRVQRQEAQGETPHSGERVGGRDGAWRSGLAQPSLAATSCPKPSRM